MQKARGKAYAALSQLEDGEDPCGHIVKAGTFAVAVEDFVSKHCRRHNRASTAAETGRLLRVYFLPDWKNRNIEAVTKADVIAALDPILKRGAVGCARHAFAAVRKLFNWTVEQGLLELSPCTGMKAPGKPGSRDRVLSDEELALIWKSASALGPPFGSVVQLLMLTAQRRGEVVAMQWAEINAQGALDHRGRAHEERQDARGAAVEVGADYPRRNHGR